MKQILPVALAFAMGSQAFGADPMVPTLTEEPTRGIGVGQQLH